jgi:membrane carboxypeptidase/penicillin-binding protein PbpC
MQPVATAPSLCRWHLPIHRVAYLWKGAAGSGHFCLVFVLCRERAAPLSRDWGAAQRAKLHRQKALAHSHESCGSLTYPVHATRISMRSRSVLITYSGSIFRRHAGADLRCVRVCDLPD